MQDKPFTHRPKPQQPTERPDSETIAVGRNALRELLKGEKDIEKIFVLKGERDGGLQKLLHEASERHIPIVATDKRKLDELSGFTAHQGVVCSIPSASYATIEDMLTLAASRGEAPLLVLCDGVEDPHNLGAIIRSAECAGAHGVIIPKRRACGLTAVVSKASAGALA